MLHQPSDDIFEKGLHKDEFGTLDLSALCWNSGCSRRFDSFPDKTGNRVAGLRPFAEPVLCPIQINGEILTLLARLVSSERLDELSIAGTAAISDNYAEHRLILGSDPLHTNFN